MSEHAQKIKRSHARLKDRFQEEFIEWNNLSVRTLYAPDDRAEHTLVFVHGWGASAEVWFPLLEQMKGDNFNILLVDLPGFGASDTPNDALNLSDYCELLSKLLERRDLASAVFIGHSFGGQIITKLAVDYPSLVNKLILLNSASVRDDRASITGRVAGLLRPVFELPPLNRFKNWLLSKVTGLDYSVNPEMYPTMKQVVNEDLTPILGGIKQPTLIVWGEEDTITPPEQAYKISENIPQALLTMIPSAGHYSLVAAADAAAANIRSFIEHSQ